MLMIVEADDSPPHLVLGNYAMDRIREKITALNRELDAWGEVMLYLRRLQIAFLSPFA